MDNVGKVRNMRNHQPHKPYDRHKSLLGRVSDSVKEMLSPSWLVDLVQSVKKKTPPPNQPSSVDASRAGDPNPMQRPMAVGGLKYPHLTRGTNLSQSFPGTQENGLSQGMTTPTHGPLQIPSTNLTFTNPLGQLDLSTNSLLVNGGDEHSELSDYTMPGSSCNMRSVPNKFETDVSSKDSSRIQQMRQEYGGSVTPSKEIEERAHTLNAFQESGQQQMGDRSFLWSGEVKNESYSSPQPPAKRHKPSFNLSLFGASTGSVASNDTMSSSFHESNFYPGKTTFGGASSHRKSRAKQTTPRVMTPTRKQVQAKPLNQSPGGVTSSTARKILDSLERMSTPLSDVKKIPSYNSSLADSPLSFSPGVYRRRSLTPLSTSNQVGPPVKGLSSPGQVRVAKNLQKPAQDASLHRMAMNKAGKTIESSGGATDLGIDEASKVGSALRYQPAVGSQEKLEVKSGVPGDAQMHTEPVKTRTGKMKRERSTHHTSRKSQDNEMEEQVDIPQLSTGFTLPATNIGNIDLKLPALARPPLHSPRKHPPDQTISSSDNDQPSECMERGGKSEVRGQEFTFSSPICQEAPSGTVSPQSETFKFRSPLKVEDNKSKPTSTSVATVPQMQFTQASVSLKKKAVEPVSETPVSDSGGGGFKPAEKLKSGSVMDFLKKSTGDVKTIPPTKDAEPKTISLAEQFKVAPGSWECPTCMVTNKPEQNKCPCCETLKPDVSTSSVTSGSSSVSTTTGQPSSSQPPLHVLFSKPNNKWECPTCMVSNDNTQDKCPCCETANPRATAEVKTGEQSQEKSGLPSLSEMFKKPSGSWDCDTCLVTNKEDSTKCIACEAPKPGLKATSSFTSAGGFQFGSGKAEVKVPAVAGFKMTGIKMAESVSGSKPTEAPTTGGFKMPSVNNNMDLFANSGFKPMELKSGEPLKGGITFGGPVKSNSKSTEAPTTGGFKMPSVSNNKDLANSGFKPVEVKSDEPLKGGIIFGGPVKSNSENTESAVSTGGFKFGAPLNTADSSDQKSTSEKGGILLDTKLNTSSQIEKSSDVGQDLETKKESTTGSFSLGGQGKAGSEVSVQPFSGGFSLKTTVPSSGSDSDKPVGFTFGQGNKISTAVSSVGSSHGISIVTSTESNSKETDSGEPKSSGGFKFGASNVIGGTNNTISIPSGGSGIFGSSLIKPDDTESKAQIVEKKSEATPVFGSSVPTVSTTSAATFNFTSKSTEIATSGSTAPPTMVSSSTEPKKEENKSSGLFVFGQTPKQTTKPETAGGFSFKPSAESTPKPLGTGGFAFGSNTGASAKAGEAVKPANPGAFVFGAKQETGSMNLGKRERGSDEATPTKKINIGNAGATFGESTNTTGFAFGQNTNGSSKPFGTVGNSSGGFGGFGVTQPSAAPGFGTSAPNFGTSNQSSSTTPAFGTGQQSSATPAFGLTQPKPATSFGTSQTGSVPTFGAVNAQPNSGPPVFGSAQPTTTFGASAVFGSENSSEQKPPTGGSTASGGLFQFGATNNQSNNNQSSSRFNFGGPQTSGQSVPQPSAESGGFNFATSAASNFNFVGAQSTQQPGTFQFRASETSNPFSATPTQTGAGAGARKIKRAVRKIRKQ